jgi:hypothetical protein
MFPLVPPAVVFEDRHNNLSGNETPTNDLHRFHLKNTELSLKFFGLTTYRQTYTSNIHVPAFEGKSCNGFVMLLILNLVFPGSGAGFVW